MIKSAEDNVLKEFVHILNIPNASALTLLETSTAADWKRTAAALFECRREFIIIVLVQMFCVYLAIGFLVHEICF